jgi:hypothetical protein
MGNLAKLQRASRFWRIFFTVSLILGIALLIAYWLFYNSIPAEFRIHTRYGISDASPKLQERGAGFLIDLACLSAFFLVVLNLIRLFRLYEKGSLFTKEHVRLLYGLGSCSLAAALSRIVEYTAFGLFFSALDGKAGLELRFAFTTSHAGALVAGGVLFVLSRIMAEAYKIQAENSLTI